MALSAVRPYNVSSLEFGQKEIGDTTRRARDQVESEHEYLRKHVDPIMMPMIEKVILYQPHDVYDFMKNYLNGEPLGPARYKSVKGPGRSLPVARRRKMAEFMAEKVLPVMEEFTQRAVYERPTNVREFVEQLISLELDSRSLVVGASVEVYSAFHRKYFPAKIVSIDIDGTCTVEYAGKSNQSEVEAGVKAARIRLLSLPSENNTPASKSFKSVILIVGVDGAGKSTILSTLQGDLKKEHTPSVGFASASFEMENGTTTFYDLGGGPSIRSVWKEYYADVHGIIFVVDSSDSKHIAESQQVLSQVMEEPQLRSKPMLLFANKQDAPSALSVDEVTQKLNLKMDTHVRAMACIGKPKANNEQVDDRIEEGLTWLFQQVESNYEVLQERVRLDGEKKKAAYAEKIRLQKIRVQAMKEKREREQMNAFDAPKHRIAAPATPKAVAKKPTSNSDGPKCNNCKQNPATTKSSASKWMPVCDPCLQQLKASA